MIKKIEVLKVFLEEKMEWTFLHQSYERLTYLHHHIESIEKIQEDCCHREKFTRIRSNDMFKAIVGYRRQIDNIYFYVLGEFCTTLHLGGFRKAYKDQTGETMSYNELEAFIVSALNGDYSFNLGLRIGDECV